MSEAEINKACASIKANSLVCVWLVISNLQESKEDYYCLAAGEDLSTLKSIFIAWTERKVLRDKKELPIRYTKLVEGILGVDQEQLNPFKPLVIFESRSHHIARSYEVLPVDRSIIERVARKRIFHHGSPDLTESIHPVVAGSAVGEV